MSGSGDAEKKPRRIAGGAAAGGGLNFQAAVTAIAIIYMLRAQPIRWLENLVHDLIVGVEAETGSGGDDIRLALAGGETVEVQVKKGLRATDELWSALLAIADAIDKGTGVFGLLAVCPESSRTIRSGLQQDLIAIGEGRSDGLSPLGNQWVQRLTDANLDSAAICARLRIRTLSALQADRGDVQAARAELNFICAKESVDAAWKTLYGEAGLLIERRGRHDRESAAAVLKAVPIILIGELAPAPRDGSADSLAGVLAGHASPPPAPAGDISELARTLLGEAAEAEAEHIRKGRFFVGFDSVEAARRLAAQLADGAYSICLPPVRARLLARCARALAFKGDAAEVDRLVAASRALAPTDEATIARAFIAAKDDWKVGLQILATLDTALARSAALQIVYNANGLDAALAWVEQAKLGIADLDSDGGFLLLSCHLDKQDWDAAYADARVLTAEDFERTPMLCHVAALARMTHSVVADMRRFAVNGVPLDSRHFPLIDTPAALEDRREAARLFRAGAATARDFGGLKAIRFNATYALWLELRDPADSEAARARLSAIFASGDDVTAYIPLALAWGIPIDRDAVDRDLARRMAFEPNGNSDIAIARLAMATSIPDPKAAIAYFEAHAAMMGEHLARPGLLDIEIRLLVTAERFARARERLVVDGSLLTSSEREGLERLLDRGADGLATHDFEEAYAQSPDTAHLKRLVEHLAGQDFSDRLVDLGRELVRRTHNLREAEMLAGLLINNQRHDDVAALLADIPDLIDGSALLRSALAWNRMREGDLEGAETLVNALLAERDERDDRSLQTNILILSGRWAELANFVEAQWAARESREADELIGAAQLAQQIGSPRAADLMRFAADKGANDAGILLTAYTLATQMGREDETSAFAWFEQAAALSGEDGPVQHMSLAEIVDRAPAWNEQVDRASDIWRRGEAPLPVVAEAVRQPSLELLLTPIIANPDRTDPRQRTIVSAFSGVRDERPAIGDGAIGLDGSALVTLAKLGRLEAILTHPRGIVLPHATLSWLFLERQGLPFHQPSRIAAAHDLMRLMADARLHPFSPQGAVDAGLGDLVGRSLAAMLVEAATIGDVEPQRYVIRSAKVTRAGSFLGEAVDLSAHTPALRSCQALVDALVLRGVVTEAEEAAARRYLERAEERWPDEQPIAQGADLYLDDLSVAYLRTTGMLGKIAAAGFRAFIPQQEVATAKALIEAERRGDAMETIVEGLRALLSEAIADGRAVLDRWFEGDGAKAHPNIAILQLAPKAAVVVSDDRYMNQHPHIDHDGSQTPIWTSLDLLNLLEAEGLLTREELWAARTALRQYGYALVPSDQHEIEYHLSKSPVVDGAMAENAALKAFRENLRLAQQRGWLVLMKESPWIFGLLGDLGKAIQSQWTDDISDEVARARSHWLLACADMRNWAGCLDGDQTNIARYGMAIAYARLLMNRVEPRSETALARMDAWLEELLSDLESGQPDIHRWLIEHLRLAITVHARDAVDDE
ncbi:HTH domain-containing protein [Sphingopyxis terrae]|uniref:HTH domain-containing protein n=1 Tax=Sphingopyxis terrae TaxID=33052 RepID=UPI001C2CA004|nr:hypothetical protein [Sphingopyxis terrae]QXF12285.1 hypothetical protein HBA51_09075 [Sphingopyxis terrae subsp. terrae]